MISPADANRLMQIRSYYRDIKEPDEITKEVLDLLSIIDKVETETRLTNLIPPLHGWTVYLYGNYKHSENKSTAVLQFLVMTDSYNDDEILQSVKKQYGDNLLRGFNMTDFKMVAVDKTMMNIGS